MCGIAGILLKSPNKRLINKFSKISQKLSHRGPDSTNYYKDRQNLLIHTRLSIVDLKSGNQPITYKDKILVANGEIYNDPEIRLKLQKYSFKTKSDSESILALYNDEGLSGLKKLRGMYAFAIYDKKKKITILCRDIFGIKPLYFCVLEHGIAFSSEINALTNLNLVEKNLSREKLTEFMELQYSSGKKTIYENIFRLRPGEIMITENGEIKESILQKLPSKRKLKHKIDEEFIEKKIKESVSVHLRSDVPYCLFFSGGIDSMLIMYFMSILNTEKSIEAYKVNIDQGSTRKNDNLKKISSEYKIKFNEVNFNEKDFWNLIPFAANHIDEPIADYAILPTFKLASEASKKFKVAITGEGGDELFGGYGRYRSSNFFSKRKFFKGAFRKFKDFSNNYWRFELNQTYIENLELTEIQKRQYFDYINWLPNNLLVKLDRCLMSYGMEGRTPLIDKELFKTFFYIDDKFKIKRGYGKFMIREFLKNKVKHYDSFLKKEGFTVPINKWIPKKAKLLEKLLPRVEILKIFFTKDEIISLCKSVEYNGKNIRALWHLIFISAWYYVKHRKVKDNCNFFDLISN